MVEEDAQEHVDAVDVLLFLGLGVPVLLLVAGLSAMLLKAAGVQALGARGILAQCFGYAAALAPLSLILRSRHGRTAFSMMRLRVSAKEAATSVSLGIFTAISIAAASVLLQTPKLKTPMEDLLADTLSLVLASVLGVTVVPVFEELLFRGLLQPVLSRYVGAALGILGSALPFALLHGPQYAWSWRHVLLITVAGAAFGVRRLVTDSAGAAAVMHGAYNLVLFAALLAGRWAGSNLPKTL